MIKYIAHVVKKKMMETEPLIPCWRDIRIITQELRDVMDSIELKHGELVDMRPRLARAIASIRVEKVMEFDYNF